MGVVLGWGGELSLMSRELRPNLGHGMPRRHAWVPRHANNLLSDVSIGAMLDTRACGIRWQVARP